MKVFKYLLSLLIAFQVCIGSNSNFDETIEDLLGDSNASLASDPSVTLIAGTMLTQLASILIIQIQEKGEAWTAGKNAKANLWKWMLPL